MRTFLSIIGGVLFGFGFCYVILPVCEERAFQQKMNIFWYDSDYDKVREVASELMASTSGQIIVPGALTFRPDGKPVSVITKIASIDVMENSVTMHSPFFNLCCGVNDTDKEVRLKSLEVLDVALNALIKRHFESLIINKLPYENDDEVLLMKINLLSTYLFLDYDELEALYKDGGLDSVMPILRGQLEKIPPVEFETIFSKKGGGSIQQQRRNGSSRQRAERL